MKQPRQGYWKPQHEVFIRCMLRHEDATKAYRTAYPKASKTSARIGGIRLYGYPHIRERIEPVLKQRRDEADKLAMEQALARKKQERARLHHIRSTIAAITRKEIKKNRHFIVNGQTVTLQQDVSHAALLALISLDLKLAAGYNNWPAIEREFARFTHDTSPLKAVISKGAKQSVAEGEISRELATGDIIATQEISPCGRNDAVIFRQQTVINSPANPLLKRLPPVRSTPKKTPENRQQNHLRQQISSQLPAHHQPRDVYRKP